MFKNYFKIAYRNLSRNKGYALINIIGLAIGVAACLLIFMVISFETSFDNFHQKKESIYRVCTEYHNEVGTSYGTGIPFPVASSLRLDFPQLTNVAAILKLADVQVSIQEENTSKNKKFIEHNFFFAEPEFFKMFNFPWLAGDPKSLYQPGMIALSEALAVKYFGDWHQAIGKMVKTKNKGLYKVSGILQDVPVNTDFPLTAVASYQSLTNTSFKKSLKNWVSTFDNAYTFVSLPTNLPASIFNKMLNTFTRNHKPPEFARDVFIVQPLKEIHFDERLDNYSGHTFSRSLINALIAIAAFLLVIACVNFINLATAQAANRSKEVGVRKVLGSRRSQLVWQFLSETSFIVLIAVIIAIVIAEITLPFVNKLLEVQMKISAINISSMILLLVLLISALTFLSGFYPAIILSRFNATAALKSKINSKMIGGVSLRRGLVVLQFIVAHILIIGTLVIVSQMNFFNKAPLGFDKAAIINLPLPPDSVSKSKIDFLRNAIRQEPGVKSVSFSFAPPASKEELENDFTFDNAIKSTDFRVSLKWADADYFKTYNIRLIAGRIYYPSDTAKEFVVNETLLRKLGIADAKQALGKKIVFWNGAVSGPIVGVVKDFNSNSLKEPMFPIVLSSLKTFYQTINIKIKPGSEKSVIRSLEKLWNQSFPDYLFQYHFLDQSIANFYKQESQLAMLYKIFAGIAIVISCLGLYGLVSFMAVQRTKEVGIRKVLGASAKSIVYLLSKEFLILILLAFVIAAPVAYFIMQKWLQNYAYRIALDPRLFILAFLASILVAGITVGHKAFHAASANPVTSLRAE
ncbi:MAG: FtsX-like permease family protein [Chitinophagaceae bacterium]|nr:FtsX-like permease family protein [Chitinophagaceae bacterium]